MQRSNCSGEESSNERVHCLKFTQRKMGKGVGRESEKAVHRVRKEASSGMRDGGREQQRAEGES